MFADFLQLIARRPPADYEHGFIREVRVRRRSPPNRRVERIIVLGWIVIAVKSVLVVWAFNRYHVPVNPLWVNGPTTVFAALCTAIYLLRD